MHVGQNKNEGGRMGDFSAKGLSKSFIEAGIELERLKTGTPARILGRSIDFSQLEEQKADEKPTLFGFTTPVIQRNCSTWNNLEKNAWVGNQDLSQCLAGLPIQALRRRRLLKTICTYRRCIQGNRG